MAVIVGSGLCAASCAPMGPEREFRVSGMFGDHMVLQQGMPVPIWGKGEPGAEITVSFADQTKRTAADEEGKWRVDLDPMPASVTPREMHIASSIPLRPDSLPEAGTTRGQVGNGQPARNTAHSAAGGSTIGNVLVGEVWFCSGQSNMELALSKTENAGAAIAASDRPLIRLFNVPHLSAAEPQEDCGGRWTPCTPRSARAFSGVAYYFGVDIRESRDVPVGLIHSAWSGACAESWVPESRLTQHPTLGEAVARWHEYRGDYPRRLEACRAAVTAWEAGGKQGERPRRPKDPNGPEMSVGRLYNGMLHPILPYAIRGVLWYQGENNVLAIEEYKALFPFLIREWRRLWKQGDFPFFFVQIANFGGKPADPEDSPWAHLRDAQLSGLAEPNADMISAIDIGGSFHPSNKHDVGLRLAALARAKVYGETGLTASGPRLRDAETEGQRVLLSFDHRGSGLAVRDDGALEGFSIAGADRRFVWASARIEGSRIVVWSDEVKEPAALRYGWETNPRGNLINREGWPAVPFRTDDWPPTKSL